MSTAAMYATEIHSLSVQLMEQIGTLHSEHTQAHTLHTQHLIAFVQRHKRTLTSGIVTLIMSL